MLKSRQVLAIVICAFSLSIASSYSFAQGEMKMEKSDKKIVKKEKSLYSRLGGKTSITAVVAEFVGNVGSDDRINKFFAHTDLTHLKKMLVDQICMATGGPCKYKGKDMKSAHKGMGVTEADFNALVEDLAKALDKFKVGAKEKDELLGALGGMKGDIVEK